MAVSPRICPYCGTANVAAAQRCSACGRPLDTHPNSVDATLVSAHPPSPAQTIHPKPTPPLPAFKCCAKSGRARLAIAGAVLSVDLQTLDIPATLWPYYPPSFFFANS